MNAADVLETVLVGLDWLILDYFFVVNSVLALLLASTAVEMRTHHLDVWRETR